MAILGGLVLTFLFFSHGIHLFGHSSARLENILSENDKINNVYFAVSREVNNTITGLVRINDVFKLEKGSSIKINDIEVGAEMPLSSTAYRYQFSLKKSESYLLKITRKNGELISKKIDHRDVTLPSLDLIMPTTSDQEVINLAYQSATPPSYAYATVAFTKDNATKGRNLKIEIKNESIDFNINQLANLAKKNDKCELDFYFKQNDGIFVYKENLTIK